MTIADLIERLEKAEGPSRELDGDIHNLLFGTRFVRVGSSVTGFHTSDIDNGTPLVPFFTSSLDAVALAERVLPGFVFDYIGQDYFTRRDGHGLKGMGWTVETTNGMNRWQGQAPTLPIALVITTLKARAVQENRA